MSGITKPHIGTRLNLGHPLSQGLVFCALMNEGSGNKVHDYSGQGNTGTLSSNMVNPSTSVSGWNPGPHGESLAFGLAGNICQIAPHPFNEGVCSVVIWYKRIVGIVTWRSLIGLYPNINKHPLLGQHGSGQIGKYEAGFTSYGINIIDYTIFHQIVVNYYINTLTAYLDGIVKNTVAHSFNLATYKIQYIGSAYAMSYPCGQISSAMLYNRALSADEIAYLYAFPYCMFDDPAYQSDAYNWLLPTGEVETTFSVSVPDISFVSETPQMKFVATK